MRCVFVFFMLLVLSSDVFAASVCTHVDRDWLAKQVPPLPGEAKIVYKKEQGVLCEVVLAMDGKLVPLYVGKDFVLVGKLFRDKKFITGETIDALKDVASRERIEANEKKALKKEKRKAYFKQNLKVLEDLTLFSFKPAKADKFLYVVTDPNCYYCKELMPDLEMLAMENHLEIKVIVFPVLGPKSRNMAVQAICEKYSYEDYEQIQYQPDTPGCSQADLLLKKTMPFFSGAGLSGVPVVISGDGTWVVEGNDIAQVKQHLGLASDDGSGGSAEGPQNQ